jgi:hypothetical protein
MHDGHGRRERRTDRHSCADSLTCRHTCRMFCFRAGAVGACIEQTGVVVHKSALCTVAFGIQTPYAPARAAPTKPLSVQTMRRNTGRLSARLDNNVVYLVYGPRNFAVHCPWLLPMQRSGSCPSSAAIHRNLDDAELLHLQINEVLARTHIHICTRRA